MHARQSSGQSIRQSQRPTIEDVITSQVPAGFVYVSGFIAVTLNHMYTRITCVAALPDHKKSRVLGDVFAPLAVVNVVGVCCSRTQRPRTPAA